MGPQNALSQSERAALLTPHWSRLELPVQRGCFGAGGTCPALAMGRVAAAGAVLVALVVLGAPPAAGTELSGVFQRRIKVECHFINGTERVRFVQMHSYNREQYTHFDSDVGVCIRDTPDGEKQAWYWNSQLENPEYRWALVDMHCHYNYEIIARFLVSRRAPLGGTAGAAAWEPRQCPSGIHGTHCNGLEFQFPARKRRSCPSRQSSEGAETQVEQDLTVTFHCQPSSPHLWLS
ncbi:HLA class II histocompatibility antigen, DRB1-4 beta chain-like isoform X1 [Corvus moneduloides]|uniref:HLA class II histocompatibility antigen, DRB1-4 beta chain-like isoform X1 n=1 Tax=Corvus moneduloides TaxID=1196302 RepID=UPI0013622946|nr:HLA class II histocompatibility antigen, DRB1-4 beta chain-like isoform X1 [Corvus moneduloides]